MSNNVIVDIPFGIGHTRFENLSIEQAHVLIHLCNNQNRQYRVNTYIQTELRKYFADQESLEEAADRLSLGVREESYRDGIIDGVKWHQERSYSEKEVWKLVNNLNETLNIGSELTLEQWFEKFKK